jgi:hypothetical protein
MCRSDASVPTTGTVKFTVISDKLLTVEPGGGEMLWIAGAAASASVEEEKCEKPPQRR